MQEVNHKQLEQLIQISYENKTPLFIWGAVGIGKSDTVRSAAIGLAKKFSTEFSDTDIEDGKFGFVDVRISQFDPSDLRGLPTFGDGKTKWLPPNWLPSNPKGKGILFFDEINLAAPSIQSACYQLILDRRIGDYRLPDGWVVVAAGNRSQDNPKIFELSPALLNRFFHCELQIPDSKQWTDWALDNSVDSRIVSFLNYRPQLLFKYDIRSKDKSFPTPRVWAKAGRAIAGLEDEDLALRILTSAVGSGCAAEFAGFIKLTGKLKIEDFLEDPTKVKTLTGINQKYTLTGILAEKYRIDRKVLGKLLEISLNLETEFGVLLLRFARAANPKTWTEDTLKAKQWSEITKTFGKYL
jgi:hypothetical protein